MKFEKYPWIDEILIYLKKSVEIEIFLRKLKMKKTKIEKKIPSKRDFIEVLGIFCRKK